MPSKNEPFDVIVVGGGPGGYVCAIRCAQLGMKVACIEKSKTLGGTCLNVGCIPSKALLESSHHYSHITKDIAEHGIEIDKIKLNLNKLLARKDKVVQGITSGVDFLFKKNKIVRLLGHATLTSPNQIEIKQGQDTGLYEAKHIILATGSTPINLAIAPFDHDKIVDSTDALSFASIPKHLVVIGGGVIGLELGSVWNRLGAKVTVIEALDHILGNTDKTVSTALQKILTKQGMIIHLNTKLKSTLIQKNEVEVVCEQNNKEIRFHADKVLVAVGRKPYTENLGLEALGIKCDAKGTIACDKHFKTSLPSIYAIGDVISGPMLAHKAEEEGIALAETLAGKAGHVNYEAIPSIVYTWPEVATIGMSEEVCMEKGLKFKTGTFQFKANGRAKAMGNSDGFVKVIADAKTDRLLGVHIIGPNASELIAEAAIAFEFGASAEDIARSVHAHPTLAEALKEASLDVEKRAIHS